MSQSTCLTGGTAAVYESDYVILAFVSGDGKRTLNFVLEDFHREIIVKVFLVDSDFASTRD